MKFFFKRYARSHLLKDYAVSSFIVLVAWLSFWVHRDAVPARITLGVTTFLTMTTQLGNSSTGTAAVSYLKAIDIWNTFCMVMVFAALVEYALVNVLSRREKAAARQRAAVTMSGQSQDTIKNADHCDVKIVRFRYFNSFLSRCARIKNHILSQIQLQDNLPTENTKKNIIVIRHVHKSLVSLFSTSQGLDKFARAIYPVIFLTFNIMYWNVLL